MYCSCKKNNIFKILSTFVIIIAIILIAIIIINSNNTDEKDILTTIAEDGDNTQVGDAIINFSKNDILVGNALSHEPGSNTIFINETGIYQISYQLFGKSDTTGTFNFNAILIVNDSPLFDTINQSPVLTDNYPNRMTLTSTVILSLNSGDTLQLGALSLENITYFNARIDIEKIG